MGKLLPRFKERVSLSVYPLLLQAPVKDYLWGGSRLKTEYGFQSDSDITAEAWVLSCHKDGSNVINNGEYISKTLPEVLSKWGKKALGTKAAAFQEFPILIKLIDAKDRLSVQVHPDDTYALRVEGEYGKTEMWYVVDCEPGAQLIYGFTKEISSEEFRRRIEDNALEEVCNFVSVKKGDVFFIEAGTLHAIGAGILIAEVQQNSNTTYRVSDYGRLGADGKPRALHVDKAVDVTNTVPPTRPYGAVGETKSVTGGTQRSLASCPLFTAEVLTVTGEMILSKEDSFISLLCLEGACTVLWDQDESLTLQKGSSLFVPAGITVTVVSENAQLLYSYV